MTGGTAWQCRNDPASPAAAGLFFRALMPGPMRRLALAVLCVPAIAAPAGVFGQPYPAKTVRVIIPYPPGGGNDIIGRAIADELTKRLGQQFIVDNRPGASTIIGAEAVARAAPDGYTLFVASQTTFAIVPNLRAKIPYDPVRDYEPVSLLATQPYTLVVHPSLPVTTVKQFIALAKSRPGKIEYASPSIGTGGHLSAELFKVMTGTDLLHIPYKGAGPAIADLLGGHVSVMFATASSVHPQIVNGKLRALGTSAAKRTAALPKVPAIAESVPGFETTQWIAMHGPRGTPREVVERLNAAISASVKAPEFRERMNSQGYDAESSTPQQLAERIKNELARFGKLIKAIGLKDQ
jgi:tripartite-type tricarboxylate transporter receptor subunit TctC